MKLKFDSSQEYQLQAISSFIDLFDGQPLNQGDYAIEINTSTNADQSSMFQSELGFGNNLIIDQDLIYENLSKIQERNELDPVSKEAFENNGMNFSTEMETGTGKTYVYLRTIFELSQKYGFKKFIIVVPSVAIREGTLKNLEITAEHFRTLYNNIEFEHFVYDSKKANRLRQFATSNQLQIMVINIDAFRKDFSDAEDNKKSNVIFKENDKLSGRKPIEFIHATNPFVIIDEPQSVDSTPRAKEAIKSLNPACIFRFSATHKDLFNLVYKLDPVKAYELRLVKEIIVASVTGENAQNDAYVKLLEVDNKKGIRAKIRLQVQGEGKVIEKDLWVKQETDLFSVSNEREAYRSGFEVLDISAEPGNEFIDFTVGRLYLGQERGGIKENLTEVQIEKTIKKHLDKELQLRDKGIKVISLFFIDKVSNYRAYDDAGKPILGKFAEIFEKHYEALIKLPQYAGLAAHPVDKIHDGYFSQDKKGHVKDTNGSTKDDDDTYAKIMRNKEQLLSLDEPLKFIFSHSALREGWDNPNVFQICTLNETRSTMKKRQEIGRGLRLPVDQNGDRVFDVNINKLTVIANESYEDFANALQKEYEDDCGVTFGKVPRLAFSHISRITNGEENILGRETSEQIWATLEQNGYVDEKGRILSTFNPRAEGFSLGLFEEVKDIEDEVIAILQSYQLERHIKKDEEPRKLQINKQVFLDPEFEQLWEKINKKTTYRVEYSTEELIKNCVKSIQKMEKIQPVKIAYREALVDVQLKGITTQETRSNYEKISHVGFPLVFLFHHLHPTPLLTLQIFQNHFQYHLHQSHFVHFYYELL